MSKREWKFWAWLLSILGFGAGLCVILPPDSLIFLLYIFVGLLVFCCLPFFPYAVCAFVVNLLLAVMMPRLWWLRIPVSLLVVLSVGWEIGTVLNQPIRADYNRLAAQDIALKAVPSFKRLVLVDDRGLSAGPSTTSCGQDCNAYLTVGKTQAVLLPVNAYEAADLMKRRYRVFTPHPNCIWGNDSDHYTGQAPKEICPLPNSNGGVAVGDLIVRRMPLRLLSQHAVKDFERVEVYLATSSGLEIVMRQTSFETHAYNQIPFPVRDVSWNGGMHDNGIKWKSDVLKHLRPYDTIVNEELKLNPR